MPESLLANVIVVLYEPLDPVNIAGTVRAMKNMGVGTLRLVRPVEYDPVRLEGIAHGTMDLIERRERYGPERHRAVDVLAPVGGEHATPGRGVEVRRRVGALGAVHGERPLAAGRRAAGDDVQRAGTPVDLRGVLRRGVGVVVPVVVRRFDVALLDLLALLLLGLGGLLALRPAVEQSAEWHVAEKVW